MQCPGQNMRYWKPGAIFDAPCPNAKYPLTSQNSSPMLHPLKSNALSTNINSTNRSRASTGSDLTGKQTKEDQHISANDSPRSIATPQAPAAIGPYSQGIVAENLLFISGQLPLDPETGKFVEGGIEEHTHQCLKNIKAIAEAAGSSLKRAVKVTIFLTRMEDFACVNQVYAQYFSDNLPARSAFQVVALPKNADIEIEAIVNR
jgi:2-iminobutanoate/2-iminopropanoate deaminase